MCALLFLTSGPVLRADKVKDLQDHFDKDPHAGSKVKSLEKLADAQFEAAGKAMQANDYSAVVTSPSRRIASVSASARESLAW